MQTHCHIVHRNHAAHTVGVGGTLLDCWVHAATPRRPHLLCVKGGVALLALAAVAPTMEKPAGGAVELWLG